MKSQRLSKRGIPILEHTSRVMYRALKNRKREKPVQVVTGFYLHEPMLLESRGKDFLEGACS